MEIIYAHQISFDELINEQIDIIITSCGYETRSSHLIQIAHFVAKRKVCFLFKSMPNFGARKANEEIYLANDFEFYELDSNSGEAIQRILDQICNDFDCENVKILVDYSSMPRIWYGNLIQYLSNIESQIKHMVVYFSYTPENFFPVTSSIESNVKPFSIFEERTLINTHKPIALILGLGYETNSPNSFISHFKNPDCYLFLPSPSFNDKYTFLAKENNETIVSSTNPNNVFRYTATNVEEIESKLHSLCLNLRLKHRIIIASLGPKTFSLATFLVKTHFPDVEIWHINYAENAYDIKPSGLPIIYKAILTEEE